MTTKLQTPRLNLIALAPRHLQLYLSSPVELEEELGVSLSRTILNDRLRRAIGIKLSKMALAATADYLWYTYWLIVVADQPFGAGLVGFKGAPNERDEVEIGYGVDPACQNKGYATEAVQALIEWAFQSPKCKAITAMGVLKSNIPSQRVLQKVGMRVCGETDEELSFRLEKEWLKK